MMVKTQMHMIGGGMNNLTDKLRIMNERIKIINIKLDKILEVLGASEDSNALDHGCSHQCHHSSDYVFDGQDEVQMYTCDNCGEEIDY